MSTSERSLSVTPAGARSIPSPPLSRIEFSLIRLPVPVLTAMPRPELNEISFGWPVRPIVLPEPFTTTPVVSGSWSPPRSFDSSRLPFELSTTAAFFAFPMRSPRIVVSAAFTTMPFATERSPSTVTTGSLT